MKITLFDGALGTMLIQGADEADIYRAYIDAGSQIISANTFSIPAAEVAERVGRAKKVADGRVRVALDVAPLNEFLEPYGDLEFDRAVEIYAEIMAAGAAADIILLETFTDLQMLKAAVAAAKPCGKPVFCSMTFGEDGKTLFGNPPDDVARELSNLGVDAVGANCSLGPDGLFPIVQALVKNSDVPMLVQPNAGLPEYRDGVVTYPLTAAEFADYAVRFAELGVAYIGGCCGTTPAHISAACRALGE